MIGLKGVLIIGATSMVAMTASADAEDYLTFGGWYEVQYVKYKPSCADRANDITQNNFFPVDKSVGRKVVPFYVRIGEWDHVVFHPLEFTEDGYQWTQFDEWWPTFVEQEGGQDQAQAIIAEYVECTAESRSEIVQLVSEIPSVE